jgi:hypothetical protein
VFEDVLARIDARFARSEPRRTVRELLLGLLAPIERKNEWWQAAAARSTRSRCASSGCGSYISASLPGIRKTSGARMAHWRTPDSA